MPIETIHETPEKMRQRRQTGAEKFNRGRAFKSIRAPEIIWNPPARDQFGRIKKRERMK